MLVNVLAPVIVSAPKPPWFNVQLNVEPPPAKVLAVAAVIEIVPVPVPAVVVKFVGAALLNEVVLAFGQTRVPPLKVRFFVPVAVVNRVPTVSVRPTRLSVPFVSVRVLLEPNVTAVPRVMVIPEPFMVIDESTVTPFVVILLEPVKVIVPPILHVVLDLSEKKEVPAQVRVGDVPAASVTPLVVFVLKFAHVKAPVIVTV
jgi:hypothetical protein